MDLKQIAETLAIPLPILMTGRKGKPKLSIVPAANLPPMDTEWPDALERVDKPSEDG